MKCASQFQLNINFFMYYCINCHYAISGGSSPFIVSMLSTNPLSLAHSLTQLVITVVAVSMINEVF